MLSRTTETGMMFGGKNGESCTAPGTTVIIGEDTSGLEARISRSRFPLKKKIEALGGLVR